MRQVQHQERLHAEVAESLPAFRRAEVKQPARVAEEARAERLRSQRKSGFSHPWIVALDFDTAAVVSLRAIGMRSRRVVSGRATGIGQSRTDARSCAVNVGARRRSAGPGSVPTRRSSSLVVPNGVRSSGRGETNGTRRAGGWSNVPVRCAPAPVAPATQQRTTDTTVNVARTKSPLRCQNEVAPWCPANMLFGTTPR